MALASIPVWPFPANWSNDVREFLEWRTVIHTSETGAEQRRSLRPFPRQRFEFATYANGDSRAYLDNLITKYAWSEWYLPLWHDAHFTRSEAGIGTSFLPIPGANEGEFRAGDAVFLAGSTPLNSVVMEVSAASALGVTVVGTFSKAWPAATMVHSVRKARLEEQPQLERTTDNLAVAQPNFVITEPGAILPSATAFMPSTYEGYGVMTIEPEDFQKLDQEYDRPVELFDDGVSVPFLYDPIGFSFPLQTYNFVLKGRANHLSYRKMLESLRGRQNPFWLPTFMQDFRLSANALSGVSALSVHRAGYAATGGPRPGREHLFIQTTTGFKTNKIVTAMDGVSTETLNLLTALDANLSIADTLRMSFLQRVRLDHDNVEILHRTDTMGLATSTMTLRFDPLSRTTTAGF